VVAGAVLRRVVRALVGVGAAERIDLPTPQDPAEGHLGAPEIQAEALGTVAGEAVS
jgi:hypothetical protein